MSAGTYQAFTPGATASCDVLDLLKYLAFPGVQNSRPLRYARRAGIQPGPAP